MCCRLRRDSHALALDVRAHSSEHHDCTRVYRDNNLTANERHLLTCCDAGWGNTGTGSSVNVDHISNQVWLLWADDDSVCHGQVEYYALHSRPRLHSSLCHRHRCCVHVPKRSESNRCPGYSTSRGQARTSQAELTRVREPTEKKCVHSRPRQAVDMADVLMNATMTGMYIESQAYVRLHLHRSLRSWTSGQPVVAPAAACHAQAAVQYIVRRRTHQCNTCAIDQMKEQQMRLFALLQQCPCTLSVYPAPHGHK